MNTQSDRIRGGTPWWSNLALTAQTVREHVVDDPVLLALQISRRLPARLSTPLARGVVAVGRLTSPVVETVGEEMRGDREAAWSALRRKEPRSASSWSVPFRADAALGLGSDEEATALLETVPQRSRGAAWHAAAARVATHRGDLTGAAELASQHRLNRALARRARGDLAGYIGHHPAVSEQGPIIPVPGRVLHVLTNSLPYTSSGYAHRSQAILKALDEVGYDVSAITRPGYPVQVGIPWAARHDVVDGIHYQRLLPARMGQGLSARLDQHAQLLEAQVRQVRPALIHTTTHFTNAVVVRAVAEATGIPWVYEVRGQLADTWVSSRDDAARESQKYREFVAREAEVARSADGVVTLGEGMKQALVAAGVDPDRIIICPNAVDHEFIDEPPRQDQARAELGVAPEHVIVGTVSSIVEYEGLDLLVRAVARLAPAHPQLRLRITGDGTALPGLKVLARQLGIEHLCQFPGRIPRAQSRLHHAALDVFVVPRKDLAVTRTVTPMKSVEASAVGRPVVASRLPALSELVVDRHTGALFEAENLDALVQVLSELITDPDLASTWGRQGRTWALEGRTWPGNARRYEQLYRQLGVDPQEERA